MLYHPRIARPTRTPQDLRYWLFVVLLFALGTWLRAPALHATLASDDWDHYAMATGAYPAARAPWDFYDFVADRATERQALHDSGRLPWWSDPGVRIAFLRPLASLSVWADHALLESDQLLAHVHSAAWWWLGALAAAAVFRQLLPFGGALLAALLFTVDDAHALPLAWSASRGELIAVALMTWALWAQLEHQRRGLTRHRALAIALVCAGMASGEHALALLPFLVACGLAEPDRSLRARLATLAPLVAPAAVYLIARAALGYGASGTHFYSDPIAEPVRFVRALGVNVPLLSGDLVLGYAADYWFGEPPWRAWLAGLGLLPSGWIERGALHDLQWASGLVALGMIVAGWLMLGRASTPAPARPLRWLLAGALAALVPLAAALPMTRLTVAPALAFHAAFAWLVLEAVRELRSSASQPRRAAAVVLCAALLWVHGVQAASRSRNLAEYCAVSSLAQAQWIGRAKLGDASLSQRALFVLGASDSASFTLPYVRRFAGASVPRTSDLLLPPFSGPVALTRMNATVFDVVPLARDRFTELAASAYRSDERGFQPNELIRTPRFSVVVAGVREGLPTRLRFVFRRPLEDPGYLFVYPMEDGLRPLAMPAVGKTTRLPSPAWPRPL